MSSRPPCGNRDSGAEVAALVRQLHETQQRLRELTDDQAGTVAHSGSRSCLLPLAEEKLRVNELAQGGFAATQKALLDALPAHIALVDAEGVIRSVNEAWRRFAVHNVLALPSFGIGANYVDTCKRATGECSEEAAAAAEGVRQVLAGATAHFGGSSTPATLRMKNAGSGWRSRRSAKIDGPAPW